MHTFGEKLKRVCDKKGISRQQLADKLGVTCAAINQWMNGKRVPKGKTACKIADALEVPVTNLVNKFPRSDEMEGTFRRIVEDLSRECERLEIVDVALSELEGRSYDDEIEAIEKWKEFLDETFNSIISFAIANPCGFYNESEELKESLDGEGTSHDKEERIVKGADQVNNDVQNELEHISQNMLMAMEKSDIPKAQYEMLKELTPHILPAVYKTTAYAIQTESGKVSDEEKALLVLYGKLNSKGQKVAAERLTELTQVQSYTKPVIEEGDEF
ncbi:MAG: helix-turn-helix transcriptional regulator [Lachnospiraceae bacterium]|nr:helix-turn-helix transcriptional regulator [Lachnospiraceae bacterium]